MAPRIQLATTVKLRHRREAEQLGRCPVEVAIYDKFAGLFDDVRINEDYVVIKSCADLPEGHANQVYVAHLSHNVKDVRERWARGTLRGRVVVKFNFFDKQAMDRQLGRMRMEVRRKEQQ